MAKGFNLFIDDKKAEQIKEAWRELHPKTVNYWYEIENIAIQAVKNPGKVYFTGPKNRDIKFKMAGSFLFCKLPSGRAMSYPYPKIEEIETPWGAQKMAMTYMGLTNNQWVKQKSYGGLLTENICQAVARDLLADAIKRLEKLNYPVVMHVHDAIVSEVAQNFGSLNEFKKIMSEVPSWSEGLPIAVEGYRANRFQK